MNQHERIIVVVDPDADRATALSSKLDRRGYHVFRRSSGIDALECVAECRPDLVLSDELQDLEAPELLHSVHEASPETRVIFLARQGKIAPPGEEEMQFLVNPEAGGKADEKIVGEIDRFLGE